MSEQIVRAGIADNVAEKAEQDGRTSNKVATEEGKTGPEGWAQSL